LVNSRPAKRALHATLDASIVDMESLTFVAKGIELGWTFGIVRAISDGLDDTLPPGCDRWVDHRGSVSIPAVAGSILRTPSLIGRLREMNRVTQTAMGRLAGILIQAISENASQ
jgi:nucleoside phosphorylase